MVALQETSTALNLRDLLARARRQLGAHDVTVEFSRDVIHKLVCPNCRAEEELFAAVGTVPYQRGACPACGHMRAVVTAHNFTGAESFGERSLDRLGLPLFDVFTARSAEKELAYVIAGDEPAVLGPLAMAAANSLRSGASQ
jgi:hypothetical protein